MQKDCISQTRLTLLGMYEHTHADTARHVCLEGSGHTDHVEQELRTHFTDILSTVTEYSDRNMCMPVLSFRALQLIDEKIL